jgi:sterol O-acyltransferase
MIPGTMLLLLLFFGLLHSWFNLWAEILRYGDREFYTDWWNVSNFADYYRRWNIVVHEWLFHYVYQDILRFSKGKSPQILCFFMVFIISALVHELILAISMQFFYPILLVMFGGPGVIYTFFSRKDGRLLNVFVWAMFFIGNGLLVVFYSWEHFARKSVNLSDKYGWKAFFIPHSWGYK